MTGGSARGRRLKSPARGTRPTTDFVRSAIFDALAARGVVLSRVLDLYAGSGALGIEALSRGDGECDFVERSAANAAIIRENLRLTRLEGRSRIHHMDVVHAARSLAGAYTLLLADPPYDAADVVDALERVCASSLVDASSALVLEQSSKASAPESLGRLRLAWNRRYGDTQVTMYDARQPGDVAVGASDSGGGPS